jgi:paraquat-inducible protein A
VGAQIEAPDEPPTSTTTEPSTPAEQARPSGPLAGTGAARLLGVPILLSLGLLLAGLFLPAITVRKLYFFEEVYSLFDGIVAFYQADEYFIFAVTLVFTVVFPLGKILAALVIWGFVERESALARHLLAWLAITSKWSMLDVFIIAVTVLVVDGQLLTSADVHAGIIAFAAAVLLSTFTVRQLNALAGNR